MTKHPLSTFGRAYVGVITVLGVFAIGESVYTLYTNPIGWNWFVLAVLTLISGAATVKLPAVPATISVSETFVFTSVLLFGIPAGVLTVALDALVISLGLARRREPFYRIAFNVGALPAALWLSAHIFYATSSLQPLSTVVGPIAIGALLKPLTIFAVSYFILNSSLIVVAISLEKGLSPFRVWKDNFAWLSLNYLGGASIAALLVSYTRNIDFAYLAFVLPLLAVLYVTYAMSIGRVEDANTHLRQLNRLYMSTIETLAMAIDAKDQITHGHIRRVQHYATGLARVMGVTEPAQLNAIEAASLLHDMGKLAVPEYILNKPGPLTPAEFEKMKLHASVGADILSAIEFPYPVVPIVRHHHENWDGSGYPDGLSGTNIPIGARILSVVDCFDALTSDRPYRPRLSDKEALRIIAERRGAMYDPLIVDAFADVHVQLAPSPTHNTESVPLRTISEASQGVDQSGAHTRRLDEIAASTEEMLTLFDLARGLTSEMSLADVADVIAKHLRRLIPCSACVFFMYDPDADDLVAAHVVGENLGLIAGVRLELGQRLSGWVAANRQTIRNSDPVLDLGESARAVSPRLRSCLSTPLSIDAELVGALTLYSTGKDTFTEEHQRIIEVVAHQVSPMIRRSAETGRSRASSLRDALTGLHTMEHLRRLAAASSTEHGLPTPTSVLLIDVDNLSLINREHGREAGDRVLSRVVTTARASLRAADLLFRHGSDEFVALLMQTDKHTASEIAARVVDAVRAERVQGQPDFRLSVVTATSPEDGVSLDELIATGIRLLPRPSGNPNDSPGARRESIH